MIAPIRILIADDHAVLREELAAMIARRADMRVVAEAVDGAQAIELSRTHRPDVILIDLHMPNLGGVDAIAQIRAEQPEARVIVLTTYDGDEDIYRALRAGARSRQAFSLGSRGPHVTSRCSCRVAYLQNSHILMGI